MSSIRRIPAASLRTGMYLHKIGGSWLSLSGWSAWRESAD